MRALSSQRDALPVHNGKFHFKTEFATFLGGKRPDELREVIAYPDGSALVSGITWSEDMPITPGAMQPKYAGENPPLGHLGEVGGDAYLALLSSNGEKLLAATYFGGSRQERGVYGILLDQTGNIVISSATRSDDLPTTNGAHQTAYGGGKADVYVAKLTADLSQLLWCTYIGGSGEDWPRGGIALDSHDNIYVVGRTDSASFPMNGGTHKLEQKGGHDVMVLKLSADGSSLMWSTLVGGSSWDASVGVQVDNDQYVIVNGYTKSNDFPLKAPQTRTNQGKEDVFVAKLASDSGRLHFSSLIGGSDFDLPEHRLALLNDSSVILTGVSGSPDFPTTRGAWSRHMNGPNDGFVTNLTTDGLINWSTRLGGSGSDLLLMPTVDSSGNVYLVGETSSKDFPVTDGALQTQYGGGETDGVFAILSPDGGHILYATYMGGSNHDNVRGITLGPNGTIYLVGSTGSEDFPVTLNSVQMKQQGEADGFVVKLTPHNPS